MDMLGKSPNYEDTIGVKDQKDTSVQIVLSLVLGLGAFLGFCVSWLASYSTQASY